MADRRTIPWPQKRVSPSRPAYSLSNFAENSGGAFAVEFAFVVFPLLTLMLLMLEVGFNYWIGAILDSNTQSAGRLFLTNTGTTSSSMVDTVRDRICKGSGGLINCDRLKVDLSYHADFASVAFQYPVDSGAWRAGFGSVHGCSEDSQVVVVQAAVAQLSFHNTVAGLAVFADGSRLIHSSTIVTLGRRSTGLNGC